MNDRESFIRYSRQLPVSGFGEDGQRRLMSSSVFIVGCGALGSMVAMQLAGAGVGHIFVADFDNIEVSNLQRQFFFKTAEAGMAKAAVLAGRMTDLNPDVEAVPLRCLVEKGNASELFGNMDFIVDATDNPASKSLVEDVCCSLGKPCCIAGVSEFHGQVMTVVPGGRRFGDIFQDADDAGFTPCSIGGVMGPAAALCASVQASEVIKYLSGIGKTLDSRLLTFDLMNDSFRLFSV